MIHLRKVVRVAAAAAVVIAIGTLAAPLLHPGLPTGHDATAHLTYTFLFDRAWSDGQVPVRWTAWVAPGHGQPLFNFYQPGLYYGIQAVHAVVPYLSLAFKLTLVGLWWTGALFTYLWLRRLGRLPAALAAAIFALSPYVLLDVFVRAAYAEFTAICLTPPALWAIDGHFRKPGVHHALAAAVFIAIIPVSHLPSALVILPLLGLYALFLAVATRASADRVAILAMAGLVAGGLSAFYVLPAIGELPFVSIATLTSGYTDYRQHFVQPWQWFDYDWGHGASVPGSDDGLSFQVDLVQWVFAATAVTGLAVAAARRRLSGEDRALAFWLGAGAFALFMTTAASSAIWWLLPRLSFLQFPWRYLMLVSLSSAPVAALVLAKLPSQTMQALVVLAVVAAQSHVHRHHLEPDGYFQREQIDIDTASWPSTEEGRRLAFVDGGFVPTSAREPARTQRCTWTDLTGSATAEVHLARDDHHVVTVRSATGAVMQFNSPYFPGWAIRVDGEEAEASVDSRTGYVAFYVPPGMHRIEAEFENTPLRSVANGVTVMSAGLWVFGGAMAIRQRRRGPPRRPSNPSA